MKEKLNIDRVFAQIGELGGQQIRYSLLLSVMGMYAPQFMIQYTFVGHNMDFTCHLENGSTLQNACPNNSISQCKKVEFDTDLTDSINSEWNLVCDRSWLSPCSMSVFMAGVMVGSVLLGSLADKIGRKKTLLITFFVLLILNGASAAVYGFNQYLALKFASGFFKSGYILANFVLINELIGASKRGLVGIASPFFFALGIMAYSLMAYYMPFWRSLTVGTTLVGIPLFIAGCLVLPESPRWLLNKGNIKESIEVLKTIALGNKAKWDHRLIDDDDSEDSDEEITVQPHLPASQRLSSAAGDSLLDLFRDKFLLKLTLIQIYCWFVNGMSYYGLTLAAGEGSKSSLYWGTAVSGFVEMPAYGVTLFSLQYLKRTTNISTFMILGGTALLVIPILQSMLPALSTTLAMVGKLCISSSFAVIYIHSNEIFPTTIRNSSMGLVSVAARVGGILAPYVAKLGSVFPNLHYISFGICAFTAGLSSLWLPDTKDKPLPETLHELSARRVHVVSVQSPHTTYKKVPLGEANL